MEGNTIYIIDKVLGVTYSKTMNLRYAPKEISNYPETAYYELRLQQMWQGSDGSQKWDWIEEIEIIKI